MEIKILVTGVEGYIGSLVYKQLEIFSRYSFMNPGRSPNMFVRPIYYLDEINVSRIKNENYDFIFHCAVYGGRRFDIDDSLVYQKNLQIYNLVKNLNCNKIIHFTSAADFGREKDINLFLPSEVLNFIPSDFFGKVKNEICRDILINNRGLNLRIFNIYGLDILNSNNFIDNIIKQCFLNENITLEEDRYFDIFNIQNLKHILDLIINYQLTQDYNLVHNTKYKISDFIYFIINQIGSKSTLKILNLGKCYTGDNIMKISKIDNIDPVNDLEKHIKSTFL